MEHRYLYVGHWSQGIFNRRSSTPPTPATPLERVYIRRRDAASPPLPLHTRKGILVIDESMETAAERNALFATAVRAVKSRYARQQLVTIRRCKTMQKHARTFLCCHAILTLRKPDATKDRLASVVILTGKQKKEEGGGRILSAYSFQGADAVVQAVFRL
jgi:hypothetical protein